MRGEWAFNMGHEHIFFLLVRRMVEEWSNVVISLIDALASIPRNCLCPAWHLPALLFRVE